MVVFEPVVVSEPVIDSEPEVSSKLVVGAEFVICTTLTRMNRRMHFQRSPTLGDLTEAIEPTMFAGRWYNKTSDGVTAALAAQVIPSSRSLCCCATAQLESYSECQAFWPVPQLLGE